MGLGFRGYIGIMEKKMQTTVIYWGYMKSPEYTPTFEILDQSGSCQGSIFLTLPSRTSILSK